MNRVSNNKLLTEQRNRQLHVKNLTGKSEGLRVNNLVDSDVTEIYLYDEIGVWGITAADFVKTLSTVSTPKIDLHINTPGGDAFDGVAIYSALKNHDAEITVYVDSLAASAGSFIAMAGKSIIMGRNATMMIHDAGGVCMGNAADMKAMADLLDKVSANIATIYADKSGKSADDWRKAMEAETWYSADEAVKAGLADSVEEATNVSDSWDFDLTALLDLGKITNGVEEIPVAALVNEVQEELELDFDVNQFRRAFEEAN